MPTAEIIIGNESAIIPDITQMTLDTFGKLPDSELGAADILTLGDLSKLIDLRDFTLGASLKHWPNAQTRELSLGQYPFLAQMTIADVASAAHLYSKEVGDIVIVKAALEHFLRSPVLAHQKKLTLAQLLDQYPELASVKLEFLELSKYTLEAIPGLLNVPINAIPSWQEIKVSAVPGLREFPIHQSIRFDGEIIPILTTQRDGNAVAKLVQRRPYQSIIWNSDKREGLQPFGSFSIVPVVKGDTILAEAYFESCPSTEASCKLVGPFEYMEFKAGDSFYVSAADWADAGDNQIVFSDYKKEPTAATLPIEADSTLSTSSFIRIVAAGMTIIVGCGVPSLYLLLSNQKRSKS